MAATGLDPLGNQWYFQNSPVTGWTSDGSSDSLCTKTSTSSLDYPMHYCVDNKNILGLCRVAMVTLDGWRDCRIGTQKF